MTSRERVLAALDFEPVDRLPLDLGAMNSTGVSCFAYPKLAEALGLPPRLPRVHDTGQMLALPEMDVLDALGCDVISVHADTCTSAFDEPERWHEYDFNGRLPARVMHPEHFTVQPDGSILQANNRRMVPDSFVFDAPHGGHAVDLSVEPPREDLDELRETMAASLPSEAQVASLADYCQRARESTDKAIMFSGLGVGLGMRRGIANFSMLCVLDPDYVHAVQEIVVESYIARARVILPAIAPYVDVLMLSADDQGTQNATLLPPSAFHELYVPYYRRANDAVHRIAPGMKTFLHSCGAIFDILEDVIEAGFDALNPVQWSAGDQGYQQWKDVCRGRIALWGGGVDTQHTLPLATVEEVAAEARAAAAYLAADSGYVFCAIHNLLAEIPPEKIIALYNAAAGGREP